MKPQNKKLFLLFFMIITICDIVVIITDNVDFRWFFKPLVMLSLILYYCFRTLAATTFDRWVVAAFAFAFYGDVLLIKADTEMFFILGVFMFMLCHIFYVKAFTPVNYTWKLLLSDLSRNWWIALLLLLIGAGVYWSIYNSIGLVLKISVALYILVIISMSVFSFLRKPYTSKMSYQSGIVGALLFMASDAVLAVDMFAYQFPYAKAIIMLTYASAQYFLAYTFVKESELRHQEHKNSGTFVDNLALEHPKY